MDLEMRPVLFLSSIPLYVGTWYAKHVSCAGRGRVSFRRALRHPALSLALAVMTLPDLVRKG